MAARRHIGFFPSADRTFYNRISGLENLAFFGRMYGIRPSGGPGARPPATGRRRSQRRRRPARRVIQSRHAEATLDGPRPVDGSARAGDRRGHRWARPRGRPAGAGPDPLDRCRRHRRDLDDPEAGRDPWVRRRRHRARPGPHHLPGHRRGPDAEVERARVSATAANRRLDARRRRAGAGRSGVGRSRHAGSGGCRPRALPARPGRARRAGRGAGRPIGNRCRRARLRPAAVRTGGVVPAADDGQECDPRAIWAFWPRRPSWGRSCDATCWCG